MGKDPAADKANERRSLPLGNVIGAFLAEHAEAKRKASTAAWYRDGLERIVKPALGGINPDKVTRQDVARLHSSLHETPVQANRVLAMLGAFYGFAAKAGYVPEGHNPTRGIEKFPERARERFLTSDELARLGDALRQGETIGLPYAIDESNPKAKHAPKEDNRRAMLDPFAVAAIRLLILTGARLREILHARWEHIDFERGVIFLPDSKTGKKPIYLSAAALTILTALPRLEGNPFVIPGEKAGQPRVDLKRPWAAVTKAARLEGLRIHDLRHSFASVGAGASLGLPIIGKLLGHSQAATTHRYAHLDADPLRRAVETIGATIAAAMDGAAGERCGRWDEQSRFWFGAARLIPESRVTAPGLPRFLFAGACGGASWRTGRGTRTRLSGSAKKIIAVSMPILPSPARKDGCTSCESATLPSKKPNGGPKASRLSRRR